MYESICENITSLDPHEYDFNFVGISAPLIDSDGNALTKDVEFDWEIKTVNEFLLSALTNAVVMCLHFVFLFFIIFFFFFFFCVFFLNMVVTIQ